MLISNFIVSPIQVARELVGMITSCWRRIPQARLSALRITKNLSTRLETLRETSAATTSTTVSVTSAQSLPMTTAIASSGNIETCLSQVESSLWDSVRVFFAGSSEKLRKKKSNVHLCIKTSSLTYTNGRRKDKNVGDPSPYPSVLWVTSIHRHSIVTFPYLLLSLSLSLYLSIYLSIYLSSYLFLPLLSRSLFLSLSSLSLSLLSSLPLSVTPHAPRKMFWIVLLDSSQTSTIRSNAWSTTLCSKIEKWSKSRLSLYFKTQRIVEHLELYDIIEMLCRSTCKLLQTTTTHLTLIGLLSIISAVWLFLLIAKFRESMFVSLILFKSATENLPCFFIWPVFSFKGMGW